MQYQHQDLAYFPYQIEYAVNNYNPPALLASGFQNVVIAGLGGSGIAGWIVKQYLYHLAPLPIEVISNYELPGYAGPSTLLILSSYSGNTEETLALADQAVERDCKTCVLTTNGALEKRARQHGWPVYYAEPGFQPRMALGYSLSYLLLLLGDLFDYPFENTLRNLSYDLRDTDPFIESAKQYFQRLEGFTTYKVVVVTDSNTYPIGLRFCQQLQENAKTEAFVHQIPEANHNVIESYYGHVQSIFFFLNSGQEKRNTVRFRFLRELLEEHQNPVIQIPYELNETQDWFNLIFILDWIALLTAEAKGVNALEIPNIQTLKRVLAEARQEH